VKEQTVAAAVQEFNRVKADLAPLLETMGAGALTALVRQHHHTVGEDQGWVFDTIEFDGSFWGELTEERPGPGGPTRKRVKIFLDPETIDSIEIETFDD
jgi:hypothetical protein